MSGLPTDPPTGAKIVMPPLDTRAPRPQVVRLKRGALVAVVISGACLVGGALAWSFVLQPQLRLRAASARAAEPSDDAAGPVRPIETITAAPGSYAQLASKTATGDQPALPSQPPPSQSASPRRAVASSRTVAIEARRANLFFPASLSRDAALREPGADGGSASGPPDIAASYNHHFLLPPQSPYEVKAGVVIGAALLTAVDTARRGPVSAVVTENIFDTVSGRHLLIPQGARLIGRNEGDSRFGERRAYLVWDRIILPNGKSLLLSAEPGVDAQGAVGVPGAVDRRLGALGVATLFAGAITALGQAARDRETGSGGLIGDAGDAAAIEAAQVGGKLIDRELDVRPSVRLRPGEPVRIFVTRDLILEPFRP